MLYQILVGDFVTGQFETLQYSKVAGVLRCVKLELRLGACPCNGFLLDVESRVRFIVAHEQDLSSLGR